MEPYLKTDAATLYHARAEEVYPHLTPGSVSMIWGDGPYAMRKAAWDMMGVDGLADWYAPHIEAWGRICAPSATVYLWNTAEGWARIDPVMRTAGWTFRVLVTWLKTNPPSQKAGDSLTCWPDFTEVCAVYQRSVDVPRLLRETRLRAGISTSRLEVMLGYALTSDPATGNRMVGRWEGGDCRPSEPDWHRLLGVMPELATLGPYIDLWPAFSPPSDFCNVWTAPMVAPTRRLKAADGDTHECEKPLAFAFRAILASTRIGDTILDPFAGTNRIAVACQRLPPEERRHAIGIEMEQRWLDAVRPSLTADHAQTTHARQPSLFAAGRVR